MSAVTGSWQPLQVSVVGVRGQADRHIQMIEADPAVKLQHVYHPDPDRMKLEANSELPITDDFKRCMNSDAIIISSPTSEHLPQLKRLADYPGHIMLEKPAVESQSDIQHLLDITDDRKSRIRVNFNFKYNPVAMVLAEVIESGALGKPIHASFETNHGGAFRNDWDKGWRTDNQFTGSIFTVGIHYVQWMTEHFDNPVETIVRTSNHAGSRADDSGTAQLIWDDGFIVNVLTSYASAFKVHFQITGTDGYVVYGGTSVNLYTPRDTFDENGLYSDPPESTQLHSPWNDAYRTSLKNSQSAFMADVRSQAVFSPAQFDRDVRVMGSMINGII